MRTSLALAFAASLFACSSGDDPAPAPAEQPAAVVSPATPAPPSAPPSNADAPAPTATPTATATTPPPPPDDTDDVAFAALTKTLNECLTKCTDNACGGACLSDFQAGLPKKDGVRGETSMCCAATGFFICHTADSEAATCDQTAAAPGKNCQPVPAMDVICKQGG